MCAGRIYTIEDDGLALPWFGNVHLNPPYGAGFIYPFCEKAVAEWRRGEIDQMIAVTNSDTSTKWTRLLFESAYMVCFPFRRLKFIDEDTGKPIMVWDKKAKKWKIGGNNRPQAFWYWGRPTDRFAQVFSEAGTVLPLVSSGLIARYRPKVAIEAPEPTR